MRIYLPINDAGLVAEAEKINEYRRNQQFQREPFEVMIHGTGTASLAHIGRDGPLYVLVHGDRETSNKVSGMVGSTTDRSGKIVSANEYLNAVELATRLVADGLPRDFGDLRLLTCWAGKSQKKDEVPFAGQLHSALKTSCPRLIVTGFTGAVLSVPESESILIKTTSSKFTEAEALLLKSRQSVSGIVTTHDEGNSLLDLLYKGHLSNRSVRTVWH